MVAKLDKKVVGNPPDRQFSFASTMKIWTFLLYLALVSTAKARDARQLFTATRNFKTETSTFISVVTSTPQTYCLTNKVPITACRKRRASKFNQFEIGSIAPTETFKYVVIRHYFDY